jgi:polysaccharide deacetylase family protein (PEP-CTERM system associated)
MQAFTVDVEDYFQVNAFGDSVPREDWDRMPSRVVRNVDALLGLLDRHDAKATFFILGWVADRHPSIPREIAAAGHEIASHGWWHRRVLALDPDEFRAEVRDSKAVLEDLTGKPVVGYRAPSFSLLPSVEWAYDVLLEEGYVYDSSVFPIRRRGYGNPDADPRPHDVVRSGGVILEIPMATREFAGMRIPGAGGAYLRILPFGLTLGTAAAHEARGESGVFYTHPWEVDPDQPRLRVPPLTRLRHYTGLGRMMPRLERLFGAFDFGSIEQCFATELARVATRPAAAGGALPFATPVGT